MSQVATDWTETAKAIAALVQAAAIVVGGIWAYFKFVRGRTFAPRCEIDLQTTLVTNGAQHALRVEASLRNTGAAVKVGLDPDLKLLYVFGVPAAQWKPNTTVDWGSHLSVTEIFASHGWLESQETIRDEAVIPVNAFDDARGVGVYRVECQLVGKMSWWHPWWRLRRKTIGWSAVATVPVGLRPAAAPKQETPEIVARLRI
jgi:hypothetical protein